MPDDGGNVWGRLARTAHRAEELESVMLEMAQYIIDRCEDKCCGDSYFGIDQCEWWRCTDGECYLKQLMKG